MDEIVLRQAVECEEAARRPWNKVRRRTEGKAARDGEAGARARILVGMRSEGDDEPNRYTPRCDDASSPTDSRATHSQPAPFPNATLVASTCCWKGTEGTQAHLGKVIAI